MDENGIVTSVGSLGKDFAASDNRSYWNLPQLSSLVPLEQDWEEFLAESRARGNRRAVMRTLVRERELRERGTELQFSAAIPTPHGLLVYLEHNEHPLVSSTASPTTERNVPASRPRCAEQFVADTSVTIADVPILFQLWQQFGWTEQGVATFVERHHNPITVFRNESGEVVGAMIAEGLQFGSLQLVEVTEMAVLPEYRGCGIARQLIQRLSAKCFQTFGPDAIVYGEFNLTTSAHRSASSAGMSSSGILHDHVSIRTGEPKINVAPWQTEYLHSFQVMYWSRNDILRLMCSPASR